jgi:hypothetical protein
MFFLMHVSSVAELLSAMEAGIVFVSRLCTVQSCLLMATAARARVQPKHGMCWQQAEHSDQPAAQAQLRQPSCLMCVVAP